MKVIAHVIDGSAKPLNFEGVDEFNMEEEPDGDWTLFVDGENVYSGEFAPSNITVRTEDED